MTAEDLLDAYRDEMAPTLGRAFIEGFIDRNRSSMLRMLAPLVALMNAKMRPSAQGGVLTIYRQGSGGLADINIQESVGSLADASARYRRHVEDSYEGFSTFPMGRLVLNGQHYRVSYNGRVWAGDPERGHPIPNDGQGPAYDPIGHDADGQDPDEDEDPDEVTPEKDAIVWAAFRDLVNEKRRAFGMQELDEVTESMPFFGRREPDRKEIVEFIQEIKETRKSDWRLAEVLAMHFEFPEAKIVKWLNDHNICPGATTRTMASKCDPSRYKAPKKAEGWLSRKLSGRPKREDLLKVIRELKRERRGDWMLAPTLAGSFGVPDATIVEWLKFHDICPRATARSMASQCVIEDVESLPRRRTCNTRALRDAEDRGRNAVYSANIADAGLTAAWRGMTESLPSRTPIAITLRHPKRRDLVAMVTASASEPGRYQLTWADNDGPSGHTTRDTPEAAVRHAIEEGYRLDTANSTEAREMVESVQQERERRAAEIESWLTESLPSPKHAGRMGDGFKVGEHVIRIGDMIKMEGQLGGYVRSVDRSKGTAVIEQDNDEVKTWPIASLLHDTAANRQRQQDYNDKLAADAEAKLELSLADWRAQ